MVDIDEVDDEGAPLRHPESFYEQQSPSFSERIARLFRCWRHCHMSLIIWVTLVLFGVVVILGAIVLRSNRDASGAAFPTCNRLYSWVLAWVIVTAVNSVWYSIEEGFRVQAVVVDPTAPGGMRELPLSQQNSAAFVYVRVMRLVTHFVLTIAFFVVGWEIMRHNGTCPAHTDLKLYFKVRESTPLESSLHGVFFFLSFFLLTFAARLSPDDSFCSALLFL